MEQNEKKKKLESKDNNKKNVFSPVEPLEKSIAILVQDIE